MSLKQNTTWLEAAKENAAQAIIEGDYALALSVADDVYDAGFRIEATAIYQDISDAQFKDRIEKEADDYADQETNAARL